MENRYMNILFRSLTYSMLLFVVLPAAVQAQASDRKGNYYRNETPVQAPSKKPSARSLWRVVVEELNCRQNTGLDSPISRTYPADAVLEVEVYRGGSDEVLVNPLDKNDNPWMPVRGAKSEDTCFVRANSRYIQPVMFRYSNFRSNEPQ